NFEVRECAQLEASGGESVKGLYSVKFEPDGLIAFLLDFRSFMVGRGRVLRSSLRALVVVAIVISGGLSLGCWGWRLSPVGLTRNRLLSLHGLGGSFFQLASFTVEEGRATDGRGGLFQVADFDG